MHNDDSTLLEALDAGASALVLKSAPPEDVIAAVRRPPMPRASSPPIGLAAAMRASRPKPRLTPRETEVLMMLVGGASVGKTGQALFMSESTVKTHVGKIYDKLGAHNRAEAVMAAVRLGLVKTSPEPSLR